MTYVASLSLLGGLCTCVYLFFFTAPVVRNGAFLRSPDDVVWAEVLTVQQGLVRPVRDGELRIGGEDGYCPEDDEADHVVARWTEAGVHLSWRSDAELVVTAIKRSESNFEVLRTTYLPCPKTEEVWTGETWIRKPIQRKPIPVTIEFR